MNVYLHDEPLSSGHKFRGIGFYTKSLIKSLNKLKDIELLLASENPKVPLGTDIIHYPYFDLYEKSLKIHGSIPTVVTVHDVIPLVFPERFPAGIRGTANLWFQIRALNKAACILTDSDCSKSDISQSLRVDPAKIHTIRLAASKVYKRLTKSELERLDVVNKYSLPKKYLLYVGDVNWHKNVESLIEAFKSVKRSEKDLELILVGKAFTNTSIPEVQRIDAVIESLKLKNSVRKLGFVETQDLVGIFNNASAYVQPSYYEGFGLSVLEAMACGAPVISTKGGSLGEILSDAAIITGNSPKAIAKGIRTVLALSENDRQVMIKKGIQNAQKYTWEKTAKQTRDIFKSLLSA